MALRIPTEVAEEPRPKGLRRLLAPNGVPSDGVLDVRLAPEGFPSDEPPMENDTHLRQMLLLLEGIDWLWRDRADFFAAGNLTIFFSPEQLKSQDFRGPDFFVVLGTERRPRGSWVVWDEGGKYPNLIVEILSESTAKTDRGLKKQIYQDVFRTPEYLLFHPETLELVGYHLVDGVYQPMEPDAHGRLVSRQLGLSFGVHEGKLRMFTAEGELVPTGVELGLRAEAEARRAEAEARRAEALAAKLRAMGVDPDEIG